MPSDPILAIQAEKKRTAKQAQKPAKRRLKHAFCLVGCGLLCTFIHFVTNCRLDPQFLGWKT
jgi:hypothetical protein